jgi:hypothetical protein
MPVLSERARLKIELDGCGVVLLETVIPACF